MRKAVSACRENLDTLGDFEKGRYIFRSCIRRRTRVRQSARTKKASKHKAFSMNALCLSIFYASFVFCISRFFCFPACGRTAFSTV